MGMKGKLQAGMIGMSIALSSCAYVQTHKNVEQINTCYDGQILKAGEMELYRSGDQWYLSAQRAKYKLVYPTVHDEVLFDSATEPSFHLLESGGGAVYHEISKETALVLQREDGYFQLNALAADIKSTPGTWVAELPAAKQVPIQAEISGKNHCYLGRNRIPQKTPLYLQALSAVDFVFVDVPGTVLYNVAIPFMAPFVFFTEFLSSD